MPDARSIIAVVWRTALLVVALGTAPAGATTVPDPTRPAVAPRTAEPDAAATPADAPVLQSTLISPSHRRAIISGRSYRVGDAVGEARLEAIGPGWVRLATPTGRSELRLSYPNTTRPVNR